MASTIAEWLKALELEHLTSLFEESQVSFRDLPLLNDDDLKDIGLALGPRRRVLNAIEYLEPATVASNTEALTPEFRPEADFHGAGRQGDTIKLNAEHDGEFLSSLESNRLNFTITVGNIS